MGAWGYGPFDNDDAGDLGAELAQKVKRALSREAYRDEGRAAARLLLTMHGTDILGGPSLAPCVELLRKMLDDKQWIDGCRSPTAMRRHLQRELDELLKRCSCARGAKKPLKSPKPLKLPRRKRRGLR